MSSIKFVLAIFREIYGFANLGSDIDKETMAQLTRGERLVEILKKKQNGRDQDIPAVYST